MSNTFVRTNITHKIIRHLHKMSTFIQKLNPMTGANTWTIQNEEYDYHQEVARSAFADMLHDTERNQKYSQALKTAIDKMHSKGKKANVLDIGTGTGLLSMMAVKHGADTVTACEAFTPMSECAYKIIVRNGFRDKITIIPKRSTDLVVGNGGDLQMKCNILVTEVFDTELIGEGALQTFKHAHEILLEKDCIVVPQSATVFVQIPDCSTLAQWNKVNNIHDDDGKLLIKTPDRIRHCTGSPAVHDVQIQQIKSYNPYKDFSIFEPVPVFRFDWSGNTPILFNHSTISTVKAPVNYTVNAVFMWWELQMDVDNKITLSCAPDWAHPDSEIGGKTKNPWRDHWMQAIYYLPEEILVEKDQEFYLLSCHDEYSLWFKMKTDLKITCDDYLRPVCECGLHASLSRTRIGQINDPKRNKKYLRTIETYIKEDSVVLILSDGFYTSLAASHKSSQVYVIESNFLSRRILLEFIEYNKLLNVEVFESPADLLESSNVKPITIVLGEPYFVTSILPWDNLLFAYCLKQLKSRLVDNVEIFPRKATIKAVVVLFDDLHKIRSPLKICEGFNMDDFDQLIEASSEISDDDIEAQPLWEYPGIAVSPVHELCTLDLANMPDKSVESQGTFDIFKEILRFNGIAFWVEWTHGNQNISTGPISDIEEGKHVIWDQHTRQGVVLFQQKSVDNLNYKFKFDVTEGHISFKHS